MKLYYLKLCAAIILCFHQEVRIFSQNPDPTQVLTDMIAAIRNIKTIQFSIVQTERIKGEMQNQVDAVKMQMNPLKIFIEAESPGKSYEVLWVTGANNGDAWVHPGAFPYFTLSLNPEGSTMKIGHHSIFELNLNYLAELISNVMSQEGKKFEKTATFQGVYNVNGRICYKIVVDFPSFRFLPYIVKEGEDLVSIANKNHLSEFMILERNKNIENYSDIKPGQTILIPEQYAKSFVLYIDKNFKLPVIEMMYDDVSLFERYEFKNIKLNPKFSEIDFSKNNTQYHF